jgi:hypothetical protein
MLTRKLSHRHNLGTASQPAAYEQPQVLFIQVIEWPPCIFFHWNHRASGPESRPMTKLGRVCHLGIVEIFTNENKRRNRLTGEAVRGARRQISKTISIPLTPQRESVLFHVNGPPRNFLFGGFALQKWIGLEHLQLWINSCSKCLLRIF